MSTRRSGAASASGFGAAAAVTAVTVAVMTAVTTVSMGGASPAHRERKQVSAYKCAPMAPRAEMRACGRVRAGVPS